MKRIDRYDEYLLEKEFKSIIANILLIVEAQTSANTFEWDFKEPQRTFNFKDKDEFEIGDTVEFDIEQKKKLKDYIDFVKNKANKFVDKQQAKASPAKVPSSIAHPAGMPGKSRKRDA